MTWQERAQQLANWPGWRRHAPAAGSAAVHLAALAFVAATLGVASGAPPETLPREDFLAVELVTLPPEESPPPEAGVSPPRISNPRPAPTDATPSLPDPRRKQQGGQDTPTTPGAETDTDSVYIPPSILKGPGPAGLQGLAGDDACSDPIPERRPRHCASDLAGRVGTMDTVMPRSKDDLARFYADYMPTCPYKVGCEPGVRRTVNGSLPAGRPPPGSANDRGAGTPQAGGPAGLGGLHDSVGRLGFNPDHTDPGFGD